jgi:hypothetical protein
MKRKLSQTQMALLMEAARRYARFHMGEPLTQAWTGLGSATAYKPVVDGGYMEIATSPNPGHSTWYRLTIQGAAIVRMLTATMTLADIEKGAGW